MEFFDEDGNFLGEGKEIFDGDGELIGHFLEKAKDSVSSATSDIGSGEGSIFGLILVLLIIAPGWALLGIVVWLIVKVIKLIIWLLLIIIKFILRCIWWLIRMPFTLILYREFPEF